MATPEVVPFVRAHQEHAHGRDRLRRRPAADHLVEEAGHDRVQVDDRIVAEVELAKLAVGVHLVAPRALSRRCPDRPAFVIAAKFAGVAISSSSYQPEMCSTGTSTSAIRCW